MTRYVLKRSENSGAKTPFGQQKKKSFVVAIFSGKK